MRPDDLKVLLEAVAAGTTSPEAASRRLTALPFENLGFAAVDHHRALRTGFPEVVFGPGKTRDQIVRIVRSIRSAGHSALVTRVTEADASPILDELPRDAYYDGTSQLLLCGPKTPLRGRGTIAVVSAGTSDGPVAEEAAQTCEIFGNEVLRVRDVGVAGLHRLLAHREIIDGAEIVIAVAGMEGALPSVLAGLISRPVIAVPTSVGVGAHFGGIVPMLAMLNSCAPGVTVVNIDGGFNAAMAASLMNRRRDP